ncbi:cell number regulator 8-like [Quercus lobata]|uniref:Cell number regulator 8 n=1 Tax=Quercus lobata TaxID=97700 RepID=A0A7N2LDT7_QUELO|nr:cell number regulator 8-like [Quercus lobata]XP_030966480.1 cell number regulator 8-like [Quercus lobata]
MASAAQDLNKNDNHEESSPLLAKQEQQEDGKKTTKLVETNKSDKVETKKSDKVETDAKAPAPAVGFVGGYAWTADGLPLRHGGSVVGEPMGRSQWNSSLCCCLGRNDEFCSSDLEVCVLGSFAPCVLYGSNAERLGSNPGTFANHCSTYTALYLIGKIVFGWNCLAPCFSYNSRTAIRRRFNLEGSCEALHGTCGCCGSFVEDEVQREQCESACDFVTHVFCHQCSLCQEGREIRRRMPHPAFNAQPFLVMIPPVEQAMGRGA